jgi:hypothetical protein
MTAAERIARLYNDAADIVVISAFLVLCVVFFLPGVQNRAAYGLAALGLAVTLGVAARWAPFIPPGGEIVAAILGVVCGPVTVAAMQGKTLFEVLDEIRKARRGGDDA